MQRLTQYRFQWVLPGHGQKVYLTEAVMRQQLAELVKRMK
jgi:hypothetical protein